MEAQQDIWTIILAAGDGTRLRSLTTDDQGITIPKQFCSFKSPKSMLAHTLDRAGRVAPRDRIVLVVAAQHQQWWEPELSFLPQENIVIQPQNRGTAIGILLPLLVIQQRDPSAVVVVLPSDHFVANESVMEKSLTQATITASENTNKVILLGIAADAPDTEYGWIVPSRPVMGPCRQVDSFIEKPPQAVADALLRQGALWNSFILVASVSALIQFYERTHPNILHEFPLELSDLSLDELYDTLPSVDFSHDILERNSDDLWVLPVPSCGWSDLGTPQKIVCLLRAQVA